MSKCVLPKAGEREGGILMWIADQWQDYELLDCGGGEKLERWDKQYLVRPDPQAKRQISPISDRRRTLGEKNTAGKLANSLR